MATCKRKNSLAVVLLVLVTLGGPGAAQILPPPPLPAPTPPPVPPPGSLDPLAAMRVTSLTGRSRVIVRARDAAARLSLASIIEQAGGVPGRELALLDAVAADVPNPSIAAIASNPLVSRVAIDRLILGTGDVTNATVGAAGARAQFGFDGTGIGVAVIDSGVTSWHDDLTTVGVPGSQRVHHFVDLVNDRSTPYDDYGHGTHIAGIIAGNGFDSNGARAGIAPGSHLVVAKVLDNSGRGHISDVIAAFDYVIQHKQEFNIRIVNLSVATGVFESYNGDFLTLAAKRAVDAGIVVVTSAGNAGRRPDGRTQYGAITAPGNAPWVLTVGASSHMGTLDRSDDTIAPFSSRGPTAIDRAAKPDLVAPGVGIVSLSDPTSAMFVSKGPYLLNGSTTTTYPPYLSLNGTSQAAPVVAGTVALMLHANPSLTPNAVKAILQYTAEAHENYDTMTQGAGFLNTHGAVELSRFFAAPGPETYPANTLGWARAFNWGNQRLSRGYLVHEANAFGVDVAWGAATTPIGQAVRWGFTCGADLCDIDGPWIAWESVCNDAECSSVVWDQGRSRNVVWGTLCAGSDCQDQAWRGPPTDAPATTSGAASTSSADDDTDTIVWGTNDSETIVWGTGDSGETIVWGTACDDPSCTPVVWEE